MAFQQWSWPARWSAKCGFVGVVTFFTLYPNPRLLVRNVRHWRDLNALVQPDAPAIKSWAVELGPLLAAASGQEQLPIVERFVYEKLPYEHDWVTWGVADYVPTVAEAVAAGREDCDGRAVVAASLLRRFDPTASLATDFRHVWVATAAGTCMHPSGPVVLAVGPAGTTTHWWNLIDIRGPAYALAVFPLVRELIIVLAVWLALADPRMRGKAVVGSVALLMHGLLVVKLAARNPWAPVMWGIWLGVAEMVAGMAWMASAARRARRGDLRSKT